MGDPLHWLGWAGGSPWLQVFAIVMGTFVLEDAATVMAAVEAGQGRVGAALALAALYGGIVAGDLGLYGLGWAASRFAWAARWRPAAGMRPAALPAADPGGGGARPTPSEWLCRHTFRAVFVSRFLPGARLPCYTACGFLRVGFVRFALATGLAATVWTTTLFTVSLQFGRWLVPYLGVWHWLGVIGIVAVPVASARHALRRRPRIAAPGPPPCDEVDPPP